MKFDGSSIPTLLQTHDRWLLWAPDGAGKKAPHTAAKPGRNCDATKATNWTTFAGATDSATRHSQGIGFALGVVQDGPAFAGVDLDACRNPETGAIEEWARKIITFLNSYAEVSPSGTGVKIFVLGTLPDSAKQGKVYKVELYDRGRYFTVTGNHLAGTPTTVEDRTAQLRDLHTKLWDGDLVTLTRVFGFYIAQHADAVSIRCPWEDHHSTPSKPGDCGLELKDGGVVGFHCFHAGCSEKHLADVKAFFGLKGNSDFITGPNGQIVKGEPDNIRRALDKLGYALSFDRFAEKVLVTRDGITEVLTEALYDRSWFAINETFHFLPPSELFYRVVADQARANSFHPVLNYLNSLRWDGTRRLDTWLSVYGGAEDTPYTRAVGALPLMAAVRRVRQPGCKFDEMLVLENSKQGTNKSTALSTLCPHPDWFSDDLALGLDSQEVIERTAGKWLIEAAELKGIRSSETEKLKNFLSRCTDGPARRAYGRISEERQRQFIFVGTTNSGSYLRDSTGNRRYWPVRVDRFDVFGLRRDRDQLWAEAAVRESAPGESIRLPPELWAAATEEQEARRQDDAWEEPLLDAIGDTEVVTSKVIWEVLAVHGASPSNSNHGARVAEIMERNGFAKPKGGVRRIDGKPTRCWVRANSPLLRDLDDAPVAVRPEFIRRVTEG